MRMRTTALILVTVLALGASLHAQAGRGGQAPAAGAQDTKTVMYNIANSLGMLRGLQEEDSITTLEFWATGTMTSGGQTYKLTNVRGSYNYAVPGLRLDMTRTGPDGKSQRVIEVVGDKFSWNETEPGMNATPMPATFNERILRMWTLSPLGVVKQARAAGANAKIAAAAGGGTTITFPAPGVSGATLTVTLNAKNLIDKVEARVGTAAPIETTFGDFGELNDPDYRADVFFPRRITQRQGTTTLIDLTINRTNTYNPYVIMPPPPNVEQAGPATK
jgi:hypothetical protein